MTKLMSVYCERRELFLSNHPICSVYLTEKADQIHHVRGRAGTLLLDTRFWKAVCQHAHDFIHDQPGMAREAALLCPRGDWNRAPNDAETKRLRALMAALTK